MNRRLFNLAAALSLLLCVATAGLWMRSYFASDAFYLSRMSQRGEWRRWSQHHVKFGRGGAGYCNVVLYGQGFRFRMPFRWWVTSVDEAVSFHQVGVPMFPSFNVKADTTLGFWFDRLSSSKPGIPTAIGVIGSGAGKLPQRTGKLGPDCEDAYAQIYPTLCALVHPGPSSEVRESLSDFVWVEKQIGFGYFHTFTYARMATILVCDLLGIRQHVEGFDVAMQRLNEWLAEAGKTLRSV